MRSVNYLIAFLAFALCILLGWWLRSQWSSSSNQQSEINIAINTFQEVARLATVEMPIEEILSHEKYNSYDWDIFSGKMIYKASGKVVAGINLDDLNIEIDSTKRVIYFHRHPKPEILYVESDISYYDIQEGLFFSFESEDFNEVQRIGRDALLKAAKESNVSDLAEQKWEQVLSNFEPLLQALGWKVIDQSTISIPDQLKK